MRMRGLTRVRIVAIGFLLLNIAPNAFGQEEVIRYRHTLTAGVAVGEVISESGDQTSSSLGFATSIDLIRSGNWVSSLT